MKNIYKANLNTLSVRDLEIRDGAVTKVLFNDTVIKEDILFYNGILGAYISFEHNTRLADRSEAEDYIRYSLDRAEHPENVEARCSYADYQNMQFVKKVTNREFRQMKKQFKEAKKRR